MSKKSTDAKPALKRWVRPLVEKIVAGQAEVGTRSTSTDGGFTTS